ncbi:MAG: cell filamentation protein Fic [Candidatus Fluviicola riflensis]|nr:MAG: cell filamentation protein Fic [Candidatus Fluviicola riflensis]OGS77372.1 MAG: cell filamentation protein Fic [Candidatus Fluviicola riflensis]OGS83953.1 MAG: cell filamentation protein Fic [Fluviicola sp. RIFCSPHIGHO2_12_FULL_43_24]OGS84439.1 MAG: cell filamentation protein Fic [Fluviicola sp. RIFCSPHIGHO2_01_FULL_43_53]
MNLENTQNFLFYANPNGKDTIQVVVDEKNETVWTTQKGMSELFEVDRTVVTKHLKNIYAEGELHKVSTSAKIALVQKEGDREVSREVEYYNLDAIISVGYRVNSQSATRFRIWATGVLREYLVKGFVIDDDRLKQGESLFNKDYFDELIDRIREIRASERRFYLKITDIYEQCSIDYKKDTELTQKFFRTVQNKLHWAITGKTAAQLIAERVDSSKPNMGLQTWRNSPNGKILKSDVSVAKNYLIEKEIKELERIVTMYLDYAENQANRKIPMKMKDWISKLDAFLEFNEYQILADAGSVKQEVARSLAENEYDKFRIVQDSTFVSDFEKQTKNISAKKK